MLDAWWKTLSVRLDSGPAALHRLPETIAHIAAALWMQALEEAKRRAALEQRDSARVTELDKQRLEVRSHVLTLREGELDSRLRDRDRTIADLRLQLRELNLMLKKQQATQAAQGKRNAFLEDERVARGAVPKNATRRLTPRQTGRKPPKRTGLRSKRNAGEKGRLKTSKSRKRP
jgi:hypothetical protein